MFAWTCRPRDERVFFAPFMQIPGYEILEKLGEGGTATVWKARQIALERLVALKVLSRAQADDPAAAERFRTEGLAAAKLMHRNIVQVFDAGEINGQPYFAMEFVEGHSVGDVIARKGKLKPEEALAVAESVAVALKHAWDRAQIIHCDIKPDNILIEKYGVVKVADLGLARIISHREGHAERDVIGTPNYVSPEQAQGGLELDYRSDIYSLGATLYHMTTGVMPFATAAGAAAMDMHITDFLRDPAEIVAKIPASVSWLIEKMMIRDRALRYASWSEVVEDIELVHEGKMPMPPLPEAGQSVVSRSAARDEKPALVQMPEEPEKTVIRVAVPVRVIEEVPEEIYDESPNIAVNPEKMRAKLGKVLDKHQPVPVTPANLILRVAIAAAVAVAAFWMVTYRSAPDKPTMWESLTGGTPPQPAAPVMLSPDGAVIHPAGANNNSIAPGTPAPTIEPPAPVQYTSNELHVIQNKASLAWDDADYQRAASLYNNALMAFGHFQQTRENPAVLKRCEANVRTALEFFDKCKDRAPKKYDVDGLIQKCNKLLFDVHNSMQVPP